MTKKKINVHEKNKPYNFSLLFKYLYEKMRFNTISHKKESGNKKEMAMTINVLHVIHFKMRILCDLYSKFTLIVKICCFFVVFVCIHIYI